MPELESHVTGSRGFGAVVVGAGVVVVVDDVVDDVGDDTVDGLVPAPDRERLPIHPTPTTATAINTRAITALGHERRGRRSRVRDFARGRVTPLPVGVYSPRA
jgi:hypothetical protein